jgi:multicomponent Na+:H+ antiporter subunit E
MSYAIQFLMCYLLWVLLVWPFKVGALQVLGALLAWPFVDAAVPDGVWLPGAGQDLIAGAMVAGLAALFFGRFFPRHGGRILNPLRYLWLAVYLPIFAWACLVANLDVAYRVLHLRLPIRPAIVKVRIGLKSEMGRFILANSITLTPGTLSVDLVGPDLYIHWINVSTDSPQLRAEMILGQFEGLLKKVFD